MAKAQKIGVSEAPLSFKTREVRLSLTPEEAYAVMAVLGQVGGNPLSSPRKFTGDVYNALCEVINPILTGELWKESNITFNYDSMEGFLERALAADNR
tara:strand:+ start:4131 stop:4424 length:294 start_codon:yes stop_codon:yes gene_type:complete